MFTISYDYLSIMLNICNTISEVVLNIHILRIKHIFRRFKRYKSKLCAQTKQNSNKTESKSDCVSCGVNISEETVGFVYTVLSNTRSFSNRPNNPHPGPLNTTLT